MGKETLMRTIHFVFVLVIAAAVTAEEMPRGFEIEGGKERQQKAADDLQRLVKSRFPSPDDVGPGWYRPWQGPPRVRARGLVPSEAAFWKKVRPPLPIAQFFGMEPAEAEQVIRKALKEGMAKLRGQPMPRDMPKELAPS